MTESDEQEAVALEWAERYNSGWKQFFDVFCRETGLTLSEAIAFRHLDAPPKKQTDFEKGLREVMEEMIQEHRKEKEWKPEDD